MREGGAFTGAADQGDMTGGKATRVTHTLADSAFSYDAPTSA